MGIRFAQDARNAAAFQAIPAGRSIALKAGHFQADLGE
jgi:hypothetical protein